MIIFRKLFIQCNIIFFMNFKAKILLFFILIIPFFISACESQIPITNKCNLEPDPGPCKALFPSYYFDQNEQECKEFNWGGCNGVRPFETLEECKNSCETENELDTSCAKDKDCKLVNLDSTCSLCPPCSQDMSGNNIVAVNAENYKQYRLNQMKSLCPDRYECSINKSAFNCPLIRCQACDLYINDDYTATCDNNVCTKSIKTPPKEFQGAQGTIFYAEGDCMPMNAPRFREYIKYNGYLYFIDPIILFNRGANMPTEEALFNSAIKTQVKEGYYEISLNPGTYVVMLKEVYSPYTNITVEPNKATTQDFSFLNCLTY